MNRIRNLVSLSLVGLLCASCRFCSEEVACEYDRDCIPDVLPFCTTTDGGVGTCTDDPFYEGDYVDVSDRLNDALDGGTLTDSETP